MAAVTVCIPTYNRCAYLHQALESVLAQAFTDFEVLIADNGSSDDTKDLLAKYAKADPRIKYHRFPENLGLVSNFRYVLTQPKTEFVALLPDDDLWLPHHLGSAMDALQSVPDAVLYGCTAEFFGDDSGHAVHQPYWSEGQSLQVMETTKRFAPWLKECPIAPVSVVFRSSARNELTWYADDSFGPMDWLWWGQIALCGTTVYDPRVGAKLRWHKGSQSHTVLRGKRPHVQSRYVIRHLAAQALNNGALTPAELVNEVLQSWPIGSAAHLVVALASYDTHPTLRNAAFEIFEKKAGVKTSIESTKHCRMANRIGPLYLTVADVLDRMLARWWRPRGAAELPVRYREEASDDHGLRASRENVENAAGAAREWRTK
jgi:Glycosyl transferase family 2